MAPQLHNLVPHEERDHNTNNNNQYCNNWVTRKNKRSHIGVSEDKNLELRLGLPGGDDDDHDQIDHDHHEDKKALLAQSDHIHADSFIKSPLMLSAQKDHQERRNWLANRSLPSVAFVEDEPKPSYLLPFNDSSSKEHKTNVRAGSDDPKFTNDSPVTPNNCCEKRPARAPVVGWPPVRSFRKNLGSNNSSKTQPPNASFGFDHKKGVCSKGQVKIESINNNGIKSDNNNHQDHMFVKINMEGVPIGRKVDLLAYDSYEKLSYAIDELFRGLLEAQKSSETTEEISDNKTVSNGEYTLVYEDNEGDRMLVGDVPWKMFVSTAKRLRVLRAVELSSLKSNCSQIERTSLDSTMKVGK